MDEIIDALGGNSAVAELLDCTPNAVSNWRKREIPWRLRPTIALIASERGIDLPPGFLGVRA